MCIVYLVYDFEISCILIKNFIHNVVIPLSHLRHSWRSVVCLRDKCKCGKPLIVCVTYPYLCIILDDKVRLADVKEVFGK